MNSEVPSLPGGRGAARTVPRRDAAIEGTLTASRALLGVIARSLAPVMDTVTLPQFRVLVVLSNFGPLRMGEVAHRLGANQSSFSRFADRMVAGGLIARSTSPGSRREVIVSLTEDGARVYNEVTDARRREIEQVLEKLSATDLDAVRAGFEIFARAAGEPSADETLILGI
ncbi:MarR family winged helix-turn-helix transcriptional regulator [Arthrobacter sp. YAF34]|uniref:MarR family winged helix-turn-helix transcriptional regulator n=1 Tax=Arthrobacter sp. YAF34 TaxID=3233083 RepID=UPI003F93F579